MIEAFSVAAKEQDWSDTEIELAVNQTKDLSLDEKYEVLLEYCMSFGDESTFTQEDVQFMLSHLREETHYLWYKPILEWDEYDFSNFQSLKRQATKRIKRVYALFAESVAEKDKYQVTSPPQKHYDTEEEALEAVPAGRESEINIYALWVEE